jgi:hypothetical protein
VARIPAADVGTRSRGRRRIRSRPKMGRSADRALRRPVALDREAPLGERPVQGRGEDDGSARVNPGDAAARA